MVKIGIRKEMMLNFDMRCLFNRRTKCHSRKWHEITPQGHTAIFVRLLA